MRLGVAAAFALLAVAPVHAQGAPRASREHARDPEGVVGGAGVVGAASLDVATQRFLARARAGTKRYESQDAEIADGYKLVGVEFPAMGEHWVHLGDVLEDSLIAERPSVLIYVTVQGKPHLAGVAYTDLLHPGEPRPAFPAAGMWHEHNGSVADESFPLTHEAMQMASSGGGDGDALRLAVLHAWLWTPNPAGVFATENWSLPLLRLGMTAAPGVSRDALNALALALDDDGYFLLTLRTGLRLTAAEEDVASGVIAGQRARAEREAGTVQADGRLTAAATVALGRVWADTWVSLGRSLPSRTAQLRALRLQLAGAPSSGRHP